MNLTAELFLVASFLLSLLYAWAAFYAVPKSEAFRDSFGFFVIYRLCIFFLHVKGLLHQRTIEQKYAACVSGYGILSVICRTYTLEFRYDYARFLIWLDAVTICVFLLHVAYTRRLLPWRRYKRSLSGQLDMFCYHIRISCGILLFILQYALAAAVISSGPFSSYVTKSACAVLLLSISAGVGRLRLLLVCALILICGFLDTLKNPSMANVSLVMSLSASVVFLGIDTHLEWSAPARTPRRIRIAEQEG